MFMGVVRGVWVNINVCVHRWGRWVGCGVLKGYEWIGSRGEEKVHHHITILHIQFIHGQIPFQQPDKHN